MSIITEKILLASNPSGTTRIIMNGSTTTGITGTMNINFTLSSRDSFTGYQQEIDNLTEFTSIELVNPEVDVEVRRFKLIPSVPYVTLNFNFYSGSVYGTSYTYAGFMTDTDQKSTAKQNSFYILDFYDTYNTYTQRKLFTTYLTKLGTTASSTYTVNIDNQLYYWYVPKYYMELQTGTTNTVYFKITFFNAKTGKTVLFYNQTNESLTTPEKMFFKAELNFPNKTWNILNLTNSTLFANELINSVAFTKKVNNTVDTLDNIQQNPPSGSTLIVSDAGANYGTITKSVPVLTTDNITNITTTTITVGGNVLIDGGLPVYSRGIVWNSDTELDTKVYVGSGLGAFSTILPFSSFVLGTPYYFRAFATNTAGTGYGNEVAYTPMSLPIVTTAAVSPTSYSTATGGGNVSSDGGSPVTARGIAYSTSANPTIAGTHTTDGNGLGAFTSSMTGLVAGTPYYVRAYATNGVSTAYGNEVSITIAVTTTTTTTTQPPTTAPPTTAPPTTAPPTTAPPTTAPPTPTQYINMSTWSSNNGDSSAYSEKCSCFYAAPVMTTGQQYRIHINSDLCVTDWGTSGAWACVQISCNSGTNPAWSACLCSSLCCNLLDVNFLVNNGDIVNVYNIASSPSVYSIGSRSQSCISLVDAITGTFVKGTTCDRVCAYTGGIPPTTAPPTTAPPTTAPPPPVTFYAFASVTTNTADYRVGGAFRLYCCDGTQINPVKYIVPSVTTAYYTWSGLPVGTCYYFDFSGVSYVCGSPPTSEAISGCHWDLDNPATGGYTQCTTCFTGQQSANYCVW